MNRIPRTALVFQAILLAWALSLIGLEAPKVNASERAQEQEAVHETPTIGEGTLSTAGPSLRIRQGTRLIKELGYFKMTGDRLTFHSQRTELKFRGLENLALERIARTINDATSVEKPLLWEISGEFTEYRGGNYLLITHAVLRAGPEVESATTAPVLSR